MELATASNYEDRYLNDLLCERPFRPTHEAGPRSILSAESDILVVAKSEAGFSLDQVLRFRTTIEAAAAENDRAIRYLVIDLCGDIASTQADREQFEKLAECFETLVQRSSIITVVCARGIISGPDLELALAANMLVADEQASFIFDTEPTEALGLYGLLARKIGFAPAERLMDQGQVLTTQNMMNLFLVRESLDLSSGMAPFWSFMKKSRRRYNSACAIYRAQSIAAPSVYRSLYSDL